MLVDDASMLEDTATKAYGWTCVLDHLRAGSQNHPLLTRFTDLLQLWVEKVRQTQDVRYLSPSDLISPEAKGLREQLAEVEESDGLSAQVRAQLEHVARILDPDNLAARIAWIELRQDGGAGAPIRSGTRISPIRFLPLPEVSNNTPHSSGQ